MGDKRKKHRSFPVRMAQILAWATALFVVVSLWRPAMAAGANSTLIFVVDSSERMLPYMAAVKGAIFALVDKSAKGDTLGIITSSDTAKRLLTKKISGPRDRKSLEGRLSTIEATGETCDLAAGVARALEELGQLRRRGDRSRKGVIVVAASRSSEESRSSETLEAALERLLQQIGKKEWYIQYCYLNGVRDRQLEDFVSGNNGLSHDVDSLAAGHDSEPVEELYRIFSTPQRLSPPKLLDLSGAILAKEDGSKEWAPLKSGAKIPEKARLRVASNSRAVIRLENCGKLGLAPETHLTVTNARQNPLTDTGRFSLTMEAGSIWLNLDPKSTSALRLTTSGGTVELLGGTAEAEYSKQTGELRLNSFSETFCAKIPGETDEPLKLGKNKSMLLARGKSREEAHPVEARLLEKWKSWRNALVKMVPLAALDFSVPEIIFPAEEIALGPIESREIRRRSFPLQIAGVDNLSDLKIDAKLSLDLPDGLVLSTGVEKGEDPGTKILKLRIDGSSGFKSRRSETHLGFLWLSPSPKSRVLFGKIGIPITVVTKGPIVPPSVLLAVLGAIAVIVVAAAARKAIGSKGRAVSRPHAVIGRLVVVNDPTGGNIGTINLEELGTKSSRLSLVVGRDRTAEVRLRHKSVKATHCTIEAYLAGGRLQTYIEPIESAKIVINGERIKGKTLLTDGAKIVIGDFSYQFEDTQMYKKVEVVRRNGRKISGILDAAGMDAEGFRLSPMDAVSPSERARVKFADIRHATFYRRVVNVLSGTPRPMPKPETMKRVELMFKKGNTISGYIQREYTEGRRRYVELLPLETGSDIDYTVVDYSAVVEKKTL